ncbi:hypothetical protein ALC60_09645, partial [Trachymyrmex zeteki]
EHCRLRLKAVCHVPALIPTNANDKRRRVHLSYLQRMISHTSSREAARIVRDPVFNLRMTLLTDPELYGLDVTVRAQARSGPRNEQRKSIGWHCGFVPSTVVLDLYIGTIYGTCFIKLKSLLCWDVFVSVLKYSFVPLNFVEIVGLVILINYCNYKIICSVYNYFNLQNKRR